MTIICQICRGTITAPAGDQAQAEIMKLAATHLGTIHQAYMQELGGVLQTAQGLITTYLLLKYMNVPGTETDLLESHAKSKNAILEILEFQPFPLAPAKTGTLH